MFASFFYWMSFLHKLYPNRIKMTCSGWLKPNLGNLIAESDSAQKIEHLTNFWKNFNRMSSFCVTGAGSFVQTSFVSFQWQTDTLIHTKKCITAEPNSHSKKMFFTSQILNYWINLSKRVLRRSRVRNYLC